MDRRMLLSTLLRGLLGLLGWRVSGATVGVGQYLAVVRRRLLISGLDPEN